MYAAMENKTLLIERMIELGCDINAKNKEHYTTLHLASMYSREDTVKLLLGKKADPSASGGVMTESSFLRKNQLSLKLEKLFNFLRAYILLCCCSCWDEFAQNTVFLTNLTMLSAYCTIGIASPLPGSLARQPCSSALLVSLARQPCINSTRIITGSAVNVLYGRQKYKINIKFFNRPLAGSNLLAFYRP
jgi:hypothetical protein